jgi:hypothetical protein
MPGDVVANLLEREFLLVGHGSGHFSTRFDQVAERFLAIKRHRRLLSAIV